MYAHKNVQYFIKSELLCLFTTGYSHIVPIYICVYSCIFILSKFEICKYAISIEIHVYYEDGKTIRFSQDVYIDITQCDYYKLIDNTIMYT